MNAASGLRRAFLHHDYKYFIRINTSHSHLFVEYMLLTTVPRTIHIPLFLCVLSTPESLLTRESRYPRGIT